MRSALTVVLVLVLVAGVVLSGRAPATAQKGPVQNVYVRKVEKVNGRLQNTVIHTFPGVSQFWTYKPEEFLKAPVYSRDNPPCKHCS